jgi:hypothetical protein
MPKLSRQAKEDADCLRFNNAMQALIAADAATYAIDLVEIEEAHLIRNRALEETWAAYQAGDCHCTEKPHRHEPTIVGEGGYYNQAQIEEVEHFLRDHRLQSMRGVPLTAVAYLIRLARGQDHPMFDGG